MKNLKLSLSPPHVSLRRGNGGKERINRKIKKSKIKGTRITNPLSVCKDSDSTNS